jgi:hypothetical protein
MAMAREQQNQNQAQQQIHTLEDQRRRVEDLARSLTQQANEQWRKAIEGMVALPAAITVGVAASTLYFVGFVTRGLEIFQEQTLYASQQMQQQRDGTNRDFGRNERGELGRPEMPTA